MSKLELKQEDVFNDSVLTGKYFTQNVLTEALCADDRAGGDIYTSNNSAGAATCRRLASVTMDDVLDSLLAMRRPSLPDEACHREDSLRRVALRTRPGRSHLSRV